MKQLAFVIILLFSFHVAGAQTPTRLRLKQLELAPDSTGYVIMSDSNRVAYWENLTTFDTSITNEIQQIDTLSLSGTTLSASLSSDGTAAKTVNLSPLLSGYVTGSGTATQIPYWNGTGSITGSNRLTYGTAGFVLIRSDSTVADRGLRVTQSTGDVAGASITIRKSRGTISSPAAVQNGDIIGANVFQGYSGTQYLSDNAFFGANVSGTVTTSSVPTSVFFIAGGTALKYTPDFLVHHTGKVGIGSSGIGNIITGVTEPPVTLSVFGTDGIRFAQGTIAQRPTGAAGIARLNTQTIQYEGHDGTAWRQMSFPGGTSTYTLRADGSSNWVASSLLTNDGNIIRIIGSSNRFYFSPNNFTDGITPNLHIAALNNAENDGATMAITSKLLWARVFSVLSGGGVMITPSSESVTTSANTMLTINRNVASNLLDLKFNGVTTGLFSTGSDGNGHLLIRSLGTTSSRGLSIYHHQSSIAGASFSFFRSRGTGTSSTALANGDIIGASVFRPYDGSNYTVDNCFFGGSVTGAVSAGNTPSSLFFIAGATSSYLPDLLVHSGGNVGIGSSGTGDITSTINTPPRQLTVYGEARITDLTTDPPTRIVGADADGDLGAITVGAGLILSAGTLAATGTGTVTGSGTTDYIPKFTSSTALGNSVLQESSSKIGIGVTPAHTLDMESATDAIDLPGGTTAQRPTNESELLRYNSDNARVEYADGTNWRNLLPSTSTTGSAILPAGTTGERDGSPSNGFIRYNTTTGQLEAYVQSAWANISASPRSYADMVSSGAAQYTVVSTEVIDTVTNIVASGFTHSNGVLTYTGTTNKNFLVNISAVVGEADTDAATAVLRLYQNSSIKGVSQMYCALQDEKYSMSISRIVTLATNDTLDCRLATGGDWIVSNFYFNVTPID